ncbi:MAG TPA: ATP-dependent acyl-CoA ligase [Chloroflexota bacterium]|jgi:crotonobetaine/carnitine-CoA ligase|nr:ATP-dependent acyl-CoA ligase [Chloroflexota bacterium]
MPAHLWQLLETAVDRTPDKLLLRHADLRQSYADFRRSCLCHASALRELGVRQGQNVCLMLGNGPDYLYTWFGLARLGAVAVPINVHLKGEGLAYVLEHSQARLLVVDDGLVDRVGAPPLRVVTAADLRARALLAGADAAWSRAGAEPRPEDVAGILYTSGTTGPPKGVMLSHRAYLSSARHFAEEMVGATADDVLYTALPLFHINAQAHTVLPAIHLNATIALGQRFSASGFWDDLRRHGATLFNSLAAMLPILCKQPPSPRDRDHRARLTACAATPRDVWLEFERRFGVTIVEGYGLTETAGFCVANPLGAPRIGSIGRPMSWIEARIVDDGDRPRPPGEPGQIALRPRGRHLFMEGYYRMPEQTAEAMPGAASSRGTRSRVGAASSAEGGWFHSGDAGRADADGYLYFVDRIKQSIRRRGENVSSWEVEKIVNAHPKVLESAAVGHPSDLGEEDVRIVIVPRPGETIDPIEIVRWCEERMAYFMVPRYVETRDALPKTATERVEKYRLKEEGLGPTAWDREQAGYRLRR